MKKIKINDSTKLELSFENKKKLTRESFQKIKPEMMRFDKKINELYLKNPNLFKKPDFRYYSNKNIKSIYHKKYAYITSIFISEEYIPAAFVLAESLRNVQSKYPIICMVQDKPYQVNKNTVFNGVSEKGIKDLLELFDMVIGVNLLKVNNYIRNNKMTHFTNSPTYKNIIYYITKGQMLGLTQFKKVFYLDASTYVVENIDDIFHKYSISTFQYDKEWKETQVGYHGADVLIKPKLTYYYKLLIFIENYSRFFDKLYFSRGLDELLIFYSIFPHWNYEKLPSNFRCTKVINSQSCKVLHFIRVKPFRMSIDNSKPSNNIYINWNHLAKNILQKKPHFIDYYKHISKFREQHIF